MTILLKRRTALVTYKKEWVLLYAYIKTNVVKSNYLIEKRLVVEVVSVVNNIQNYHGVDIRSNIGKLKDMQNAIWAICFHMIMGPSNETLNEQHQYCSVTPNAWCKYQVDQINDTSFYNRQNFLPPVFRSKLHYIFKRLRKVPIIPLRFISKEHIPHLQVQSGKQF